MPGSNHFVSNNRFLGLNRNRCTTDRTRPHCDYSSGDPELLRSGIYVAGKGARPVKSGHNQITGNVVSGFGMRQHCVAAGPRASLTGNDIGKNECLDER